MANFLGGETLNELKKVLISAETEILGGTSLRVSPFVDIKSVGSLLQSAGFNMPVVDSDKIIVTHKSIINLLKDLRNMAENSSLNYKVIVSDLDESEIREIDPCLKVKALAKAKDLEQSS